MVRIIPNHNPTPVKQIEKKRKQDHNCVLCDSDDNERINKNRERNPRNGQNMRTPFHWIKIRIEAAVNLLL